MQYFNMSKEFLTTFNPTWQMNVFDLIVYLALAWAVFNGWRRGFLLQLLSLVAVVAGVYVAIKYGSQAGALLGLEGTTASIIGFLALFLAALIVVTIAGHLLRAVLRFSGLGMADVLLGILFSTLKVGVIVSVLFSWFSTVNCKYHWVDEQEIEQSRYFEHVVNVVDKLTPYFKDVANNVLRR